ncbi:MAG: N-acetyltransferase [Candidatus Brocadia sp. AMX3]|nr:N-acetyltransferase [Candidatus Brocadia sp. AMX3]
MKIIDNPSEQQLSKLQEILDNEKNAWIVDIGGYLVSDYIAAIDDSGELVGVASIIMYESENAELHKLYIAPAHRRRGIGHTLFEATIDHLRTSGIRKILIEVVGNSSQFWSTVVTPYKTHWYDDSKFEIIVSG